MDEYSKGHPTNPSNNTDLIEYERKVDFLRKGDYINIELILRGTLMWETWWQPFGSKSEQTKVPNTPWDDRIIDITTPANTHILVIIRSINDALNNTKSDEKSDITIDNVKITTTDNSGNIILDPNYDLMRINTSSLKNFIKVSKEREFINKIEVVPSKYIIYYMRDVITNNTYQIARLPPKDDDKTIIIGIEFSIYGSGSDINNPGAISRLSGIYKTDYLNVYNPNRWMAEVENSTITNDAFKYINKNYIMDIDFTDGGVGDKKNTLPEKILIKGEKGYALSGIQYVYNLPTGETEEPFRDVYCDKPIRQIVFAFDSIYNENKPTLYYYINNGVLYPNLNQNPLPIEQCYSYNMGSNRNNRLFISNFDVFYNVVPDIENIPKWLQAVAGIKTIFSSAPWDWKFDYEMHNPGDLFAGIKGIMSVQTISIKNRVIYDWIKDIDYLKCCDTQIDNLYDPDTIEEQYGRYEKDYYITNSKIPSDSCFSDILTPYCNNYYKLEYTVDFGQNEIEKIIFRIDNKSENIDNKSLKSVIINKINNILPPEIRCFNISSNIFTDIVTIEFTIKDPPIRYIDFKILNAKNNNELTIELTDEKKILEEDRCKNYCSFNNTNCDDTIKKYCLNEIDGEEGLFIKKTIKFFPKYYTIPNFNKEIEVYLPNQKRIFLEEKICGCFMSSYKEHKIELTNFYNDIKTEYQSKLNTANDANKELINKEIENINYLIKTLDLYDSEQSFKDSLDLQLQDKRLLENYKTECMFPPCLKNPFKMKSMKNTICTAPQSCIGNGFAVPELGNDVTINCNKEKGILNLNCVIVNNKLEPKFILLSDFKNYNQCKDTYKRNPSYSEIDKPSYCKIGAVARELGCENVNGKPLMKNVFDVTVPQYPLDNKSLCPPPKDKLPRKYPSYYSSSNKCKKPEVAPTSPNVKYLIFGIVSIIILIFFIFLLIKYKWSVSH